MRSKFSFLNTYAALIIYSWLFFEKLMIINSSRLILMWGNEKVFRLLGKKFHVDSTFYGEDFTLGKILS